jgi:hypothetical protein
MSAGSVPKGYWIEFSHPKGIERTIQTGMPV